MAVPFVMPTRKFPLPCGFIWKVVNDVALSVKQEKFCLEYARLGNARQAYINAGYECEKEETIDASASRLLRNVKVQERISELAEATTSKGVMTATERKEWLTEVIRSDAEKTMDKLKAVDILNKMEGAYIEKVEVNGQVNNPMAGLTTEELKKLVYDG